MVIILAMFPVIKRANADKAGLAQEPRNAASFGGESILVFDIGEMRCVEFNISRAWNLLREEKRPSAGRRGRIVRPQRSPALASEYCLLVRGNQKSLTAAQHAA